MLSFLYNKFVFSILLFFLCTGLHAAITDSVLDRNVSTDKFDYQLKLDITKDKRLDILNFSFHNRILGSMEKKENFKDYDYRTRVQKRHKFLEDISSNLKQKENKLLKIEYSSFSSISSFEKSLNPAIKLTDFDEKNIFSERERILLGEIEELRNYLDKKDYANAVEVLKELNPYMKNLRENEGLFFYRAVSLYDKTLKEHIHDGMFKQDLSKAAGLLSLRSSKESFKGKVLRHVFNICISKNCSIESDFPFYISLLDDEKLSDTAIIKILSITNKFVKSELDHKKYFRELASYISIVEENDWESVSVGKDFLSKSILDILKNKIRDNYPSNARVANYVEKLLKNKMTQEKK